MPNLLENRLLLQYLSAGGQDLLSGQPIGTNVNAVTQQNIAAQSYMKLLQKLLEGGGKMTMDKDTMSIKAPMTAFQGPQGPGTQSALAAPQENIGLRGESGTAGVGSAVTPMKQTPVQDDRANLLAAFLGGNLSTVNPSSSPLDISGADLAGLTTQDISQALSLQQGQQRLEAQSINDVFDNLYKMALIQQMQKPAEAAPQFPVPVPGLGYISLDEWKALPADTQSYAAYVYQSKLANPTEPVMNQEEWKRVAGDTKVRYLEELMERPELLAIEERLRKAGSTTVNISPMERAIQTGKGKAITDVTAPDFHTEVQKSVQKDYKRWYGDDPDQAETKAALIDRGMTDDEAISVLQKMAVLEEMDKRIRQAYTGTGVSITRSKEGWFADGELIQRNPYNE